MIRPVFPETVTYEEWIANLTMHNNSPAQMNTSSGQAVLWEEHCRLRHLPTRLYLAIVKDKDGCFQVIYLLFIMMCSIVLSTQVTLKERDRSGKSDLDTVFRLTPLIQVYGFNWYQ